MAKIPVARHDTVILKRKYDGKMIIPDSAKGDAFAMLVTDRSEN